MNPDYPFVKPRRHPNCLFLVVYLRGAPCRRQRRAFFARMHAEARRLGVVLSHKLGVCLLFGAERICTSAHRHQMVAWLIDQPEVATVDVGELAHLGDIFQQKLRLSNVDGPLGRHDKHAARTLTLRIATGAVAQWTRYLSGHMA
ncbi:MAG TPA: hypothetical protein PLL92_16085 [Alicycliphilus sp.]|nr:hypothetical protein [Alicycliphilus sp.]